MDVLILVMLGLAFSGLIATRLMTAHYILRSRDVIVPLSIPTEWEKKRRSVFAWRWFFWSVIVFAILLWFAHQIFG